MRKLVVALAIATVMAAPAFAQSYDPSVGSGNLVSAPDHSKQAAHRATPYHAYAQSPRSVQPVRVRAAPRSPYAQYDQNGNLIDENMPGRW